MKLGVAVLGVGRWGVHFVRNFLEHPQTELIAVVDSYEDSLTRCQERFDLNSNKVLLTTHWEKVKRLTNLDAVVVATPATTHYSIIQDALQSGYHVLAEKPLTLDPAECLELTELARSKNLQLLVDHTYLFNSTVTKGQEIIAAKELGDLRYGYATRTHLSPVRQDVDALWDLAIHDIAIFNYWLGESPIQVQAKGQTWLQKNSVMPISSQPGLADMVWVTLYYPSGFQTHIHLCWLNPDKQRRLCVVGSQGTLIFDEMAQETPLTIQQGYFAQEGENFIPQGQSRRAIDVEKNEPLSQVCDRFIQNILANKQDNFSSGKVGAELVKVLRALTTSLEQQGNIINL
ncbi:Oxidoreductase domain protein [Hyella patelloides LEGE 07179]|uniref:Oxidoreductase domain protein n=1 Tax=Hyella patelloides LEGE 07179 TaxID=945734 RepID=A0A563VW06_9CYAN|nr:Gfo/Idh/MocA family oxidoreductase [Hyella patelloides]VEP15433.1 Oxidoreductase domain protein [Hyella patelloides LEGE 07179]